MAAQGPIWLRSALLGLLLVLASSPSQLARSAIDTTVSQERRCLALVAYAEAAGEGAEGMAAVIRVILNRVNDPRFPDDACAVVRQPGQFQPVAERPALRAALTDPAETDLVAALGGKGVNHNALATALTLAESETETTDLDPTGGALYFLNPDLMDANNCSWFAGLKQTAQIGSHVFMTHYQTGEASNGPALQCSGGRPERVQIATPVLVTPAAGPEPVEPVKATALAAPRPTMAAPLRLRVGGPLNRMIISATHRQSAFASLATNQGSQPGRLLVRTIQR